MPPIAQMIFKRLGLGVATLLIVSAVIFFAIYLLPGDLAEELLGQARTPETVAVLRADLGLDRPAGERYLKWLGAALHGDFGKSLANGRPISELAGNRMINTLILAAMAAVVCMPISLGLGILAALYRDKAFDRGINILALTAISLPEFFVAYLLIFWLTVKTGWLPSLADVGPDTPWSVRLEKSILPILTLTLAVAAHVMRLTRAAIVNLLASPYIEMARIKGVRPWRVIVHHALPNALGPIINVVVLNLAYLIVGVVVIEVVFTYPGLGQLMVDSVSKRDVPVVQATCMIFASVYIVANLVADILSIVADPRQLHPR